MRSEAEIRLKISNTQYVAYADECGAGPLCGDVVCAAVLWPLDNHGILGINDSKKLSEKKRELLYPQIMEKALDYCVVHISANEIDEINILQARMLGMKKAIEGLTKYPVLYSVVDGNRIPKDMSIECDYLIGGDGILAGIGVASVLAKVTRDRQMVELSKQAPYSLYGLDKHKGYGTKAHLEALEKHGFIDGFHRKSYAPIKNLIK